MKKIPKLYSVRQVAALLGKPRTTVYEGLRTNRILGAHWVDKWWVIQEDFRIIKAGMDDALVRNLPPELIAEEPPKNFSAKLPEYRMKGKLKKGRTNRAVKLPGYKRVTEGYNGRQIRRLTGVHNTTQTRIEEGKPVDTAVVLRLAAGLGVDVEDFLRP